jgi:ketosteroid isomerase-like protein
MPPGHTTEEQDRQAIVESFRAQCAAMVDGDTAALGELLDDEFTLTHLTGYVQPKTEWLQQMDEGQLEYHGIDGREVSVRVDGDSAVLVSTAVVPATVYGSYAPWRLRFTMDFIRRDTGWFATRSVVTTW